MSVNNVYVYLVFPSNCTLLSVCAKFLPITVSQVLQYGTDTLHKFLFIDLNKFESHVSNRILYGQTTYSSHLY